MAYDMQPTADTTPSTTMPDEQRFDRADSDGFYDRLRPDQRTAIGNEFVRCLRLAGDSFADTYETTGGMLSTEQVAKLHAYVRERHPDMLREVWQHPVTQGSLAAPGAEVEAVEHDDVLIQAPQTADDANIAPSDTNTRRELDEAQAEGDNPTPAGHDSMTD